MNKTGIVARLAGAASAWYLVRSVLGPLSARSQPPRRIGPMTAVPALVILVAVGGLVLYLMFSGPRMRLQPKILPFRAVLPALPDETVPVGPVETPSPAPGRNPLADTELVRRAGQAYYRSYCAFCHGADGRGAGPVGRSYVPVPTDLTTPAVGALSDEALYQGMLTGVGHAPVLGYVLDPDTPWYIIVYVRSLPGPPSPPGD